MRRQDDLHLLQGNLTVRAIKTRRCWRCNQGMAVDGGAYCNVQRVTTCQSSRRVNQHVVANAVTFGVKAFQNPKWPIVFKPGNRSPSFKAVVK
jgi:hypothetical protein